jgi:hypothetical protein
MDWPDSLNAGSIREWPGELRAPSKRERAKFKRPGRWEGGKYIEASSMPLTTTVSDLSRELRALRAKDAELLVALEPAQFRIDGKPRANVTPEHPGVILSFDIPDVGRVSYPCDKYTRWEDNLRAIVLALEALRLVDRHGVTGRGEQYRGFLAIEATAAPAGFDTTDAAIAFLANLLRDEWQDGKVDTRPENARALLRGAQRRHHPDRGGDAAVFQRVSLAEARLRQEGLI